MAMSFCFDLENILEPFSFPTLISESIIARRVYKSYVLFFLHWDTLVELDRVDFDAVLGMDWLHSFYATLDCRTRRVTFSFSNKPILEWEENSLAPKGKFISYLGTIKLYPKVIFTILFGSKIRALKIPFSNLS